MQKANGTLTSTKKIHPYLLRQDTNGRLYGKLPPNQLSIRLIIKHQFMLYANVAIH